MRTRDFAYDLPPELIAQVPLPTRDASRLLHLSRPNASVTHRRITDLPALMQPGDLVVMNTSRVLAARFTGMRAGGGSAEILLVRPDEDDTWQAMVRPGAKLRAGRTVDLGDGVSLEIVAVRPDGLRRVRVHGTTWEEAIARFGTVPLPPYIDRPANSTDTERYQTVYADTPGSVAAPTAGLHFTPALLQALEAAGAARAEVVLHVGPGTFQPVATDDPAEHSMHSEWYDVPAATVDAVALTREREGRVWAIGTTTTRVLEAAAATGRLRAGAGWTDLFIRAPYAFRVVDALLTNFHQPQSTLLMLVCAFGGHEAVMDAYREAVRQGYRFWSYGDAMVVT